MIRSYVFNTQGHLQSRDVPLASVVATLADPNLFIWLDLEKVTPEEAMPILEGIFHFHPLSIEDRCHKGTLPAARAPDRVAHTVLDAIVENYKPALDELALEISKLEELALQRPDQTILNKILQTKKEVQHLRVIMAPQSDVL